MSGLSHVERGARLAADIAEEFLNTLPLFPDADRLALEGEVIDARNAAREQLEECRQCREVIRG